MANIILFLWNKRLFSSYFKHKGENWKEYYLEWELELLYKSSLCCTFDGVSVMSGKKGGVQATIKEKQPQATRASIPRCY